MSYKRLGKRIQEAREEAGLNQEQLANMLGCSQPTLSNYEKGKSRIYLPQLQKVAELLNKPVHFFLEALELTENNKVQNENPPASVIVDNLEGINISFDVDILKIISILYNLPAENKKEIYEFIQWQKYKISHEDSSFLNE